MPRVLVVDDDADQLRVRARLLELAGHRVAAASTASEALRLLEEFQADVMVTDLRLPTLDDGVALIRAAGERPAAPRIVVLSGWPQQLDERPERRRVARVLLKPARYADLLEAIRQVAVTEPRP
jgi:CheY-like chemotaxis protein